MRSHTETSGLIMRRPTTAQTESENPKSNTAVGATANIPHIARETAASGSERLPNVSAPPAVATITAALTVEA